MIAFRVPSSLAIMTGQLECKQNALAHTDGVFLLGRHRATPEQKRVPQGGSGLFADLIAGPQMQIRVAGHCVKSINCCSPLGRQLL